MHICVHFLAGKYRHPDCMIARSWIELEAIKKSLMREGVKEAHLVGYTRDGQEICQDVEFFPTETFGG